MSINNVSKFCALIQISRTLFYKYKKEGMPIESEDLACEWIAANHGGCGGKILNTHNKKKGAGFNLKKVPGVVVCDVDVDRDDVLGVLARQCKNEDVAWGMLGHATIGGDGYVVSIDLLENLKKANENNDLKKIKLVVGKIMRSSHQESQIVRIAAATRHYNLCADARLKTEEMLVKMQNEELTLEKKAEVVAFDIIKLVLSPLRQMLRSLPARLAPRCNPAAMDVARVVLDEEVERLFESTHLGKED